MALPPVQTVAAPDALIVGSASTVISTAFDVGSEQSTPLQFLTTRYQRVAVIAPLLYVLDVAPLIFAKPAVELVDEICHWYVQVPVPPEVEEETVAFPPEQMVAAPDADMDGSATTVTV